MRVPRATAVAPALAAGSALTLLGSSAAGWLWVRSQPCVGNMLDREVVTLLLVTASAAAVLATSLWLLVSRDEIEPWHAARGVLVSTVAAVTVLGVPRRVDRSSAPTADAKPPLFHRAALWPGLVLASGIAAFSVFTAFIPEHSRSVGLAGSAGLFLVYSAVSLSLRLFGAKLPERVGEHRMVTVALVALASSLTLMSAVPRPWALWVAAAGMGVGMAFMYPSLMANVINRVGDGERASALSSFTMFFEIGTIIGGVVLGAVGEIFTKRAGFLGGALITLGGLAMLWQFVVAAPAPQEAIAQTSKNSAFANP